MINHLNVHLTLIYSTLTYLFSRNIQMIQHSDDQSSERSSDIDLLRISDFSWTFKWSIIWIFIWRWFTSHSQMTSTEHSNDWSFECSFDVDFLRIHKWLQLNIQMIDHLNVHLTLIFFALTNDFNWTFKWLIIWMFIWRWFSSHSLMTSVEHSDDQSFECSSDVDLLRTH